MTEAWKQWEGQVINAEFRLHQYVGGSEHSAVFLAEHGERGSQKAALKLVPADPATATRQLDQWKLAAPLSHPHLIRLLRTGRCQLGGTEFLFVATEYAPENLSQVLPQRPLTSAEAHDLLGPALDALTYLHGRGLVHGNLKPTNIMAVEEQLKLSTDGVWRIGEPMAGAEQPGAYDPPEKARGAASPAGDVWSLGMVLAEALTQRLPAWDSAGQGEPVLPDTLPGPFADIVRNCLRRDPQRRWTIARVDARLHPATPTPQVPATVQSGKTTVQWRLIVPLVAAGLVLVAILGGSRLLHPRQDAEPSASPVAEQAKPESQPEQMAAQNGVQSQASSGAPGPAQSAASTKNNTDRVQGEVVQQVLPNVSPSARATITGRVKVRVRVQVDAAGNVTAADFESPGPSKYFARLALQAAQRWKFAPSDVAGDVPRKWILRFEFGRAGTKAFPSKAVP